MAMIPNPFGRLRDILRGATSLTPVPPAPAARIAQITTLSGGRNAFAQIPDSYWIDCYSQGQDPNTHPSLGTFTHTAVKSGNWTDPTVWNTGTVPAAGAIANISGGFTVTYDAAGATKTERDNIRANYRAACNTLAATPNDTTALNTIAYIEGLAVKGIHVGGSGKLSFSRTANTFLLVTDIVCHGEWDRGTQADPILHSGVDGMARSHIMYVGTSDPGATTKLGRMTMGRMRQWGEANTQATKFSMAPTAGATQVILDKVPTNWRVGFDIVITGSDIAGYTGSDPTYSGPTTYYGPKNTELSQFNGVSWTSMAQFSQDGAASRYKVSHDEQRTIKTIVNNGNGTATVTFDGALLYDHPTTASTLPDGRAVAIEARCAYLGGSILEEGLYVLDKGVAGTGRHRAHTMHMFHDDMQDWFSVYRNLGRTRVDPTLFDATLNNGTSAGLRASSGGAFLGDPNNRIGRYAVHIHWTGPYLGRRAVGLIGVKAYCDIGTAPMGRGIVHHHSRANMEQCTTFNSRASGFMSELGSEIGQWIDCISIYNRGDGYSVDWGCRNDTVPGHNGHFGSAFNSQARQVLIRGCLAFSARAGFDWLQQKTPDMAKRSPDPTSMRLVNPIVQGMSQSLGSTLYNVYGQDMKNAYGHMQAQIADFDDNEAHDVTWGFTVYQRDVLDGEDNTPMLASGFKVLGSYPVFIPNYSFEYYFKDCLFVGPGSAAGTAAASFQVRTYAFVFSHCRFKGFACDVESGDINYGGHLVDVLTDSPTRTRGNVVTFGTGSTDPASSYYYNAMGPWTKISDDGVNFTARIRDYPTLTLANMPISPAVPAAPFGIQTDPSPGTPRPYYSSISVTGTLTPLGVESVNVNGVAADTIGLRRIPDSIRIDLVSKSTSWPPPVRKMFNGVANGLSIVRRNGCYLDGGTWKTALWFNFADRYTHQRVPFLAEIPLSGFDAAFLAANQVANAQATKPVFPLLPERIDTYDDTPVVRDYVVPPAFLAQLDASQSTVYTSNTITVIGPFGTTVPVTVPAGTTYSKNGGAYTDVATTAKEGDTFALRVTSAASGGATVTGSITIAARTSLFAVTTESVPVTGAMFFEYFDRADNTTIDSLTEWQRIDGTAGAAAITSNSVYSTITDAQGAAYRPAVDMGSNDQWVEGNFPVASPNYYLCVQLTDRLNWIGFQYSNGIRVVKCINGVITQLGSLGTSRDEFAIFRLQYTHATRAWAVFKGGVQVLAGTIASGFPATSTRTGFIVYGATGAALGHFATGTGAKNEFADTFDRANENLETSANWTNRDSVAGGLAVQGNNINSVYTKANGGGAYLAPNPGYTRRAVGFENLFGNSGGWVALEITDRDNFIGFRFNGSNIQVASVVGGVIYSQFSAASAQSYTSFRMTFDPATREVRLYRNYTLFGGPITIPSAQVPPASKRTGIVGGIYAGSMGEGSFFSSVF